MCVLLLYFMLGPLYDNSRGASVFRQMCYQTLSMGPAILILTLSGPCNPHPNSPWAPHAQLCCSCKDCYKNCICVHTLILSLICDKIQIPEHLDERILERAINSKKAAREFAGVCRDKEADRERALIFEVLNFVLMYT